MEGEIFVVREDLMSISHGRGEALSPSLSSLRHPLPTTNHEKKTETLAQAVSKIAKNAFRGIQRQIPIKRTI